MRSDRGSVFPGSRTVKLLGADATEPRVLAELPKAHWIHVAAHGLVDESIENLFGAIALTPPASLIAANDDGFLTYHEILNLKLNCRHRLLPHDQLAIVHLVSCLFSLLYTHSSPSDSLGDARRTSAESRSTPC